MTYFLAKPKSSYPQNVIGEIKLLQLDKYSDDVDVIGSASYRKTLYPSDLDLYEQILKGTSKEGCVNFFKSNIQMIVKRVTHKKEHFFLEVKCGLDKRYQIDIGSCNNNVYIKNPQLNEMIHVMKDMKLFNDEEYEIIMNILNKNMNDQLDYETIATLLRKHYIVRWTSKEIAQGYKMLSNNGGKYLLEEAIEKKSPINIEILAILNNKISDVSNFYVLTYSHDDKEFVVNFPEKLMEDPRGYVVETLKQSIYKMLHSKLDYNPLKAAKRYFSLARHTHNEDLLKTIAPFLNSNVGYMGQMKSEIVTLIKAMEKIKKPPIKLIKAQLQNVKYKLANILEIEQDTLEEINKHIDYVTNLAYDPKDIIDVLERIKDGLTKVINRKTTNKLQVIGLLPIPIQFMPKTKPF